MLLPESRFLALQPYFEHIIETRTTLMLPFGAVEFCMMRPCVHLVSRPFRGGGAVSTLVVHVNWGISRESGEVQTVIGLHNCFGMLEF